MLPRFEFKGPPFPVRIKNPRPYRIYPAQNRTHGTVFFTERDQDHAIIGGPYISIAAAVDHLKRFLPCTKS